MIYLNNTQDIQQIWIPRQDVNLTAFTRYVTESELDNAIANETARTEETYAKIDDLSAYTKTEDFATINGSAITHGGNIEIETGGNYSAGTNIDITDNVISVTGITVPTKLSDLENDEGFITTADTQDFVTSADVKTQIEGYDYITSGDAQTQIDNSISGKVDTSAMTAYYTSAETDTAIDNAVSGKMDTSAMSAYTPTSGFSTINGSAITQGGNIEIEGAVYSAGTNINIDANNVISVTGITVPTKTSDLQNDSGFITSNDIPTSNTAFTNDAGYITTADTQDFVTSGDVATQIEGYNYVNSGDVQSQINDSISGKVDTSAMTAYWTSAETETAISNAVSGKADTDAFTAYTPTSGFSTINGSAITVGGNIEIEGAAYSAGTNINIDVNNVISVTGITEQIQDVEDHINEVEEVTASALTELKTNKVDTSAMTAYATNEHLDEVEEVTASALTELKTTKLDSTALTQYYTSAQTDTAISNATSGLASTNYVDNAVSGKVDTSAMTEYYTSAQTDTQITNAVSGKQDTLISGTNIKTINNESILGSGNIVISGGSGGSANIIELTQAEYDALTAYTPDAMYVITDAQEINMDNYATTGDIQTALDSYYTSAQTDTAISNAVSGKTDKVSVTASSSGYKFPTWNNQGCITGTSATAYQASQNVNGSSRTLYSTSSSSLPTIYAPTTVGSAGQPLLSNGSGAPVWGSFKFAFMTQAQYEQITPDSSTIYFITD